MSDTYIDAVLRGSAVFTDIEDYVAEWHERQPVENLHDFLGLSWDEYSLWVEQPGVLRLIIAARERDEPVMDFVAAADDHALMARGLNLDDARTVREWLEETHRLPKP